MKQSADALPQPEITRSYHLCLSIRGALMNMGNRELEDAFTHDDGRKMTPREAKLVLMDELAKGYKVIPCSPCDNFDYQRGCQGHDEPEAESGAGLRESTERPQ